MNRLKVIETNKRYQNWYKFMDSIKDKLNAEPPMNFVFIIQFKCIFCKTDIIEVRDKLCEHVVCERCMQVTNFGGLRECHMPFDTFYEISEEQFKETFKIDDYLYDAVISIKVNLYDEEVTMTFYQKPT